VRACLRGRFPSNAKRGLGWGRCLWRRPLFDGLACSQKMDVSGRMRIPESGATFRFSCLASLTPTPLGPRKVLRLTRVGGGCGCAERGGQPSTPQADIDRWV